jgi:hypothetical protein
MLEKPPSVAVATSDRNKPFPILIAKAEAKG